MSTIEPAAAALLTRRRGSRPSGGAWGGGAALLLGLAVVAGAVMVAGGVDLHELHVIHGDGASVHVVAGSYPGVWIDPAYDPFTEKRLRLLTPLAAFVYMSSVTAIGMSLVGAIRGAAEWPRAVRILGGFLPGYVMVLAPLQILFAAVPTFTAAWIALVAAPVVAVLLHRPGIAQAVGAMRHDAGYRRRASLIAVGTVGVVGLIVLLSAVHRLQAGRYYMLPDSVRYFVFGADDQLHGAFGSYLAQWAQQSDEWVFGAPLVFDGHAARDAQFVYWSVQFVALASFAALIYGLVTTFAWRRRALAGVLAVGMILASTPAIHPWSNVVIVGGQNPALFLAHPGRQVSVVAPWIALLILGRWSVRQAVAILLAIAGLAFTTVDGAVYVLVAIGCAGVWRSLHGRRPGLAGRRTAVAVHALALGVLATPLFVYYELHHTSAPDGLGWVLVSSTVLALAAIALLAAISAPTSAARREQAVSGRAALGIALATVATLAVGFWLSNNMVSKLADGGVRRVIGSVLPGYRGPLLDREIPFHFSFPSFTGEECALSGHCRSFPYFLAVYGFTLVLALAAWVALGRITSDAQTNRRRAALLAVVGTLALAFAILDFSGAGGASVWVLTRFVEVPYYSILAFAAIVLVASRSLLTAVAGTTVLAIWTLIPFFHSHIPEQWLKNVEYLAGTLH